MLKISQLRHPRVESNLRGRVAPPIAPIRASSAAAARASRLAPSALVPSATNCGATPHCFSTNNKYSVQTQRCRHPGPSAHRGHGSRASCRRLGLLWHSSVGLPHALEPRSVCAQRDQDLPCCFLHCWSLKRVAHDETLGKIAGGSSLAVGAAYS